MYFKHGAPTEQGKFLNDGGADDAWLYCCSAKSMFLVLTTVFHRLTINVTPSELPVTKVRFHCTSTRSRRLNVTNRVVFVTKNGNNRFLKQTEKKNETKILLEK